MSYAVIATQTVNQKNVRKTFTQPPVLFGVAFSMAECAELLHGPFPSGVSEQECLDAVVHKAPVRTNDTWSYWIVEK